MKVDVEGNVYCGGSGGLHSMNAGGETLGIVVHGQPATDEPVLRRRRLEDAVLHQPEHRGQRAGEDRGSSGAGEVETEAARRGRRRCASAAQYPSHQE